MFAHLNVAISYPQKTVPALSDCNALPAPCPSAPFHAAQTRSPDAASPAAKLCTPTLPFSADAPAQSTPPRDIQTARGSRVPAASSPHHRTSPPHPGNPQCANKTHQTGSYKSAAQSRHPPENSLPSADVASPIQSAPEVAPAPMPASNNKPGAPASKSKAPTPSASSPPDRSFCNKSFESPDRALLCSENACKAAAQKLQPLAPNPSSSSPQNPVAQTAATPPSRSPASVSPPSSATFSSGQKVSE